MAIVRQYKTWAPDLAPGDVAVLGLLSNNSKVFSQLEPMLQRFFGGQAKRFQTQTDVRTPGQLCCCPCGRRPVVDMQLRAGCGGFVYNWVSYSKCSCFAAHWRVARRQSIWR